MVFMSGGKRTKVKLVGVSKNWLYLAGWPPAKFWKWDNDHAPVDKMRYTIFPILWYIMAYITTPLLHCAQ